jgi:branched-chain amino acid aminotransferase
MSERTAYFNGEFVPESKVLLNPNDRGFRLGDMVFDVERTFNGSIWRLQQHIDRLYRSLRYLSIDVGMSKEQMSEITDEVVRRNEPLREPGGDSWVRQFVTRGVMERGYRAMDAGSPTVCVMMTPIGFGSYAHLYDEGAKVLFPKARAYSSDSVDPKIKSYNRLNFVLAQLEVEHADPEAYPVILDQQGNITENVGANFFIVTDGVLRTSRDASILQGISRMVTMELAEQLGIPVVEEDLQPYDAYTADEAFLTTSSYQVLPVRSVDKREVRHAVPGPISKQLLAAWSEMVGVDIVDQALNQAKS